MLGTKEHSDLIAQFEREHKGHRFDKEATGLWRRGAVYQSGETNALFTAYLRGYALCKMLMQQEAR